MPLKNIVEILQECTKNTTNPKNMISSIEHSSNKLQKTKKCTENQELRTKN